MQNLNVDTLIGKLRESLPVVFARKEIPKLLGNILARGTLANLASEGIGPPFIRNGRNVIYEKDTFLEWLQVYLSGGIKALSQRWTIK